MLGYDRIYRHADLLTTPNLISVVNCMRTLRILGSLAFAVLLLIKIGRAQEEPVCVENSPERRGEIGCSIVEKKPLPTTLKEPVFWRIDQFDSADHAKAGVGPSSIAFEAHGAWWLMSVGPESGDHHGGKHAAQVNLSPLPKADAYSMLVISAYIPAGMTSVSIFIQE